MRQLEATPSRKLRIAIDMDEVLADTLGKQLHCYNDHFGANIAPQDLHGQELVDIVHEHERPWVEEMLHRPGFFADLELLPGCVEEMAKLCAEHDIFIASAATEFPNSFGDKLAWLQRHFPQIPRHRVVFCGDKSILDMDYLIDDTPQYFDAFHGVGLLFDAPHNRGDNRYYRVHGWANVERAIRLHEALRHIQT